MAFAVRLCSRHKQTYSFSAYLKSSRIFTNYGSIYSSVTFSELSPNQRSFSTNVHWQRYASGPKRKRISEFHLPQTADEAGKILEIERTSYTEAGVTRDDPVVQRLFAGIKEGKRASLAKAITLVESLHPIKKAQAQVLLSELLEDAHKKQKRSIRRVNSFRIGS